MMSSSSDEGENKYLERDEPQNLMNSLIPDVSKEKYMCAYENFIEWKESKSASGFSENVFMAYFEELANKYKPNSMWCFYSMLKTTVLHKNGVDINTYSNLKTYLKRASNGYRSKQSKVLTQDDVEKFIKEAPDYRYLATKVALIMGITGACRRQELVNITLKDIQHHGQMILVKIKNRRNKIPRSFTIDGPFYEIVKKYESLRSKKATTDRFFLNYQNGKCTCQPIGINKFGSMPREIARFLGLEDAEAFTGHSFRRTSAKLLDNSVVGLHSIRNKTEICAKITQRIHLKSEDPLSTEVPLSAEVPCSSNDSFSPTYNINGSNIENESDKGENADPTYTINGSIIENESVIGENDETETPSKTVHYHFTDCTFTNCFNK